MEAKIIKLTPELAKEMLKKNIGNRSLKKSVKFLIGQMKNGEWKENGEAIIIDKNGIIKDGQHRLTAVIAANYSYNVPIITGIDADVMETIDTGSNRSLGDVLEFNGFLYYSALAGIIKALMSYNFNRIGDNSARKDGTNYISNSRGLKFAIDNKEYLSDLVKLVHGHISRNQLVNVFQCKEIALYLYVIASGEKYTREHIDFVKRLTGQGSIEGTASYWLFRKLASFKKDNVLVSSKWKLYAVIKAWNMFVKGDIPINRMQINVNNEPDKILQL